MEGYMKPKIVLYLYLLVSISVLIGMFNINSRNIRDSIYSSSPEISSEKEVQNLNELKGKPAIEPGMTINAVGDIMVHDSQINSAKRKNGSYNFDNVFSEIKPYTEMPDFTIGNLETTISHPEKGYSGYPAFRSPEQLLEALKFAGFDVLTTANNHCLDGGESGAIYTLDGLDKYGFLHTGTARSYEERNRVLILEKNDIRVAILAYTYGTNSREKFALSDRLSCTVNFSNDKYSLINDIQSAKNAGVHKIILCMHWGTENQRTPGKEQKAMADELFSMGVDIILGSHPHVLQPIERKKITTEDGEEKEVLLVYSLGNFISNQQSKYKDSGIILSINIVRNEEDGKVEIKDIYYIPTWVHKYIYSNKTEYRILPVGKFLYDKTLDVKAQKRIQDVWTEIVNLFGNQNAKLLE
jgi:poly-gamma-glutamate capsule biosynthesis protein CapA/YwtB (metallophosphatase superfamily)